jgi:uncharacterized damage-inducible protein DinB
MLIYMRTTYRKGGVGALMDEYERAAWEIRDLIGRISEKDFTRVVDAETSDQDCRSVQTIMSHAVRAGYGYANYLREAFSISREEVSSEMFAGVETPDRIDAMLRYTIETLEGRWELSDDEISSITFKTRWGNTYHMEQILEHAIVHILRHRRQIEKFAANGLIEIR